MATWQDVSRLAVELPGAHLGHVLPGRHVQGQDGPDDRTCGGCCPWTRDHRATSAAGALTNPTVARSRTANLRFAGTDLPAPTRTAVATRHGNVPVHFRLHGGAFLMRYPAMDDWWCRYVAATAGVVVANVDFEVLARATMAMVAGEIEKALLGC